MIVVVSPHPDDDVIGCGAFLAAAAANGRTVRAIYVTDGSASHVGSPTYPPERLRREREGEARAALARLGIATAPTFLGRRDGSLADADPDELARELATLIPDDDATLVLGPWRRDPHPDHRAVAAALLRTARERARLRYAEYFVWLGERGTAEDAPRRGDGRAVRLSTARHLDAKRSAIAEHRSQLGALIRDAREAFALPASLIARALGPSEAFVVSVP